MRVLVRVKPLSRKKKKNKKKKKTVVPCGHDGAEKFPAAIYPPHSVDVERQEAEGGKTTAAHDGPPRPSGAGSLSCCHHAWDPRRCRVLRRVAWALSRGDALAGGVAVVSGGDDGRSDEGGEGEACEGSGPSSSSSTPCLMFGHTSSMYVLSATWRLCGQLPQSPTPSASCQVDGSLVMTWWIAWSICLRVTTNDMSSRKDRACPTSSAAGHSCGRRMA